MSTSLFDPSFVLDELATVRKLFHSEADFQHAFAWLLHSHWPEGQIRLEYPSTLGARTSYVDIFAVLAGERVAIELKYKTRAMSLNVDGESFLLKSHGAQDLGRYDFLRDVERIEAAVQPDVADRGVAIMLTNDSAYWSPSRGDGVAYEAFRLHDGRELTGSLPWGLSAGAGTTKGREAPITLLRQHLISWRDYSQVASSTYGRLRFVVIEVTR